MIEGGSLVGHQFEEPVGEVCGVHQGRSGVEGCEHAGRGHASRTGRILLYTYVAAEFQREFRGFGNVDIKVGPIVYPVVCIGRVPEFVELLDYRTLVHISKGYEVFYRPVSSGDIEVGVGGGGEVAQHHVVPVVVGITYGVDGRARIAVFLNLLVGELVGIFPRIALCHVGKDGGIVGIHPSRNFGGDLHTIVHVETEFGSTFRPAPGSDYDYAVCSLCTEDGGGGGILEYGDGLDFVGIQIGEFPFYAIHHYKGIISVPA